MNLAFLGSHVAAEHTAAGKHAALVPPVNTSPRAPFGPSLVYSCSIKSFSNKYSHLPYLDSRDALLRNRHRFPKVLPSKQRDLLFQRQRLEHALHPRTHDRSCVMKQQATQATPKMAFDNSLGSTTRNGSGQQATNATAGRSGLSLSFAYRRTCPSLYVVPALRPTALLQPPRNDLAVSPEKQP